MNQQLDQAINFISRRGSARTHEIASVLEITPEQVDYLLAGPRELGMLITCDVQIGEKRVLEYRCSAAPSKSFKPLQPKTAAALASAESRPEPHRSAAPAPAAVPQKEAPMLTAAELITASLREHGRSTLDEIAKRTRLQKGHISTTLTGLKGVRKVARGTYELGKGKAAAAPAPRTRGKKKKKPAARQRSPRAPDAHRSEVPPSGANFAISECGALGIEKGDVKLSLEDGEFERLRAFIDRTKSVWGGARA